jgi:hypothetical protein
VSERIGPYRGQQVSEASFIAEPIWSLLIRIAAVLVSLARDVPVKYVNSPRTHRAYPRAMMSTTRCTMRILRSGNIGRHSICRAASLATGRLLLCAEGSPRYMGKSEIKG